VMNEIWIEFVRIIFPRISLAQRSVMDKVRFLSATRCLYE
jgi:hypothetical protein